MLTCASAAIRQKDRLVLSVGLFPQILPEGLAALRPKNTVRRLLPLPSTVQRFADRSRSRMRSEHNSEARTPVSSRKRTIASSRGMQRTACGLERRTCSSVMDAPVRQMCCGRGNAIQWRLFQSTFGYQPPEQALQVDIVVFDGARPHRARQVWVAPATTRVLVAAARHTPGTGAFDTPHS